MRVVPQTTSGFLSNFAGIHSLLDNTSTNDLVKIGSKVKARTKQTIAIVVRKLFSLSNLILHPNTGKIVRLTDRKMKKMKLIEEML